MLHDPDDPPPPNEALSFWFYFNRYAEHCARWARALGLI